jgi:hypothetical protein
VLLWIVLAALFAAWLVRLLLAKRATRRFFGEDRLTLAINVPGPSRGDKKWKHGYARLTDDAVEWRAEYKLGPGADYTINRNSLVIREHRPVVRGTMPLSDRCELVVARYMDEDIQLGVLRTDLDRFLEWAGA